jgi:Fibronectin type III domain
MMMRRSTIHLLALGFMLFLGCAKVEARLSAPSAVTATTLSSSGIELTWTDGDSPLVGFVVERSTDPKRKFKEVDTTDGDVRSYRDHGLASGVTYYYRMRALQEVRSRSGKLRAPRKSRRSKVASATTLPPAPTAPTPVPTATPGGGGLAGEWAQRFGGTGHDIGVATAVDASGNVVVTGRFTGAANFGGSTLTSAGGFDVFLAKYGPDGTHVWSKRFGAAGNDLGEGVAVDADGNVIVVGSFEQTVNFGGGARTSAGGWDVFVAKYSPAGAHLWSMRFGASESDGGTAVVADANGNVIVGGTFMHTVSFGGPALTTSRAAVTDLFLAKYSPDGTHLWSRSFQSDRKGEVAAVAVDGAGNVALTGFFEGSVSFGGATLWSIQSSRDAFVAKLSAAGTHLWSRSFGDVVADQGMGVAVDGSGNVLVTGVFGGVVDFGGGVLQADAAGDVFVAKYAAPSGAHLWSRAWGGNLSTDTGAGIATDGNDVVVTGSFEGSDTYPADLGGGPVSSAGGRDVFVARYTSAGSPVWSEHFGGPGNDDGNGVAVGPRGAVVVTGAFSDTAGLGGRVLTSVGGLDTFLLSLQP